MARQQEEFVYRGHKRKVESIAKYSKQSGGNFDAFLLGGVQMFKPKEGENIIRILPSTWDPEGPWGDGWQCTVTLHYQVGTDESAYLCLKKMSDEACPICDARPSMTEEEADECKPTLRNLCWVVDRNNEKAGPMVWAMPPTVFRDINARSTDKKTNQPVLIDEPEEGYDVMFTRVGGDRRTKYEAIEVDRDPSPIHESEKRQKEWLAYIQENSLPDLLNVYDAEYIEKVLFGKTDRRQRDEDDEDVKGNGRAAPRARRAARDEDEEEVKPRRRADPDEEEVRPSRARRAAEPEDDDKPAPRRGRIPAEDDEIPSERPRRGARTVAAEEEQDDNDEEQETERKPVTRRRLETAAEETKSRRRSEDREEEEEAAPSRQGKAALGRLRSNRR